MARTLGSCGVRSSRAVTESKHRRMNIQAAIRSARAPVLIVAALLASSLVGCAVDAFNVTQQSAVVRVTRVDSEAPVRGAQVDVEGRYYEGWMSQLEESERNDLWFSRGMNDPATTNEEGLAKLSVNIGMIRGGLFPEPFDPHQDRLTGQTYLFRVYRGDTSEILNVAMVPGHRSRGRLFEVAVLSIGSSRDVTQEYTTRGRRNGGPSQKDQTAKPQEGRVAGNGSCRSPKPES